MIVEGAVVMIENIVRLLSHPKQEAEETVSQKIRRAAHEVQRPVFYSIAIIITAYLPIFTLQAVEGRLFKPMAWTVSFPPLGASYLLDVHRSDRLHVYPHGSRNGTTRWMDLLTERTIRPSVPLSAVFRVTASVSVVVLVERRCWRWAWIGSEFLPHLDEGAIWVRGTLAPSTGQSQGIALANRTRIILCSSPEVPQCTSQVGRSDDGTDTTGFFNTEYLVDSQAKGGMAADLSSGIKRSSSQRS